MNARVLSIFVACLLAIAVAACGGGTAASTAAPTVASTTAPAAAPTAQPTAAPTSAPAKPAASPAARSAAPSASPAAAPSGPAKVAVTQRGTLGSILTDAAGRTLYMFTKDQEKSSSCYDQCARTWPPLLTRGQPQAGTGADASKLSTTTRRDGTVQVVYGEYPLYYYTPDTAPGDTRGQGVGKVWFVLGADGEAMK